MGWWVGGWVGGWVTIHKIMPFWAPSCKLNLAKLSAKLRIQDGAECGKNQLSPAGGGGMAELGKKLCLKKLEDIIEMSWGYDNIPRVCFSY